MHNLLILPVFALGLVFLLKGADWVTEKAGNIAAYYGISGTVIGLTLIAFSTSIPELSVSLTASAVGASGIAVGNIVGSNIANIGLVLGLAMLITPILVDMGDIEEVTVMLIITVVTLVYMMGGLSRMEGIFLLAFIVIYTLDLVKHGKKRMQYIKPKYDIARELIYFLVGICGVFVGSRLLVIAASEFALIFSISGVVIGATVVALGTSLPELSIVLMAGKKGFREMALGTIIGSNMFNLAAILAITAIIRPIPATHNLLYVDMPIMAILAFLLFSFMRTDWRLSRKEGVIFLSVYVIFIILQFLRIG